MEERIKSLLKELDAIARDYDGSGFGLPLEYEPWNAQLVQAVQNYVAEGA